MNKPDWKDAPEWAEYVAQDMDGTWIWWEHIPEAYFYRWYPKVSFATRYVFAMKGYQNVKYSEALERRPKAPA